MKYRFTPTAESRDQDGRDSSEFELRQLSDISWQKWNGPNPWGWRSYSSMPDPPGFTVGHAPDVANPLPALVSGLTRMADDAALAGGKWWRQGAEVAWLRSGVGLDPANLMGEAKGFSPWSWSSTGSLRLLSLDDQQFRTLPVTRFQRPVASPALARLKASQVRGWIASLDGIVSLRVISVAGRAVEIDSRAPESGLARLHGLYTLEARSANEVRRAVLLGM